VSLDIDLSQLDEPSDPIFSTDVDLEPAVNQINWVAGDDGDDGDYSSFQSDGSLKIENIASQKRLIYQLPGQASGYALNSDKSKALIARNNTKQYRFSFFANYFIQDVKTNTSVPLHPDQSVDIRYAVWSPK
jgi:dipeptidyl-peptidase 4